MKPIKRLYLSTDEIHLADASLVLELNSCGRGFITAGTTQDYTGKLVRLDVGYTDLVLRWFTGYVERSQPAENGFQRLFVRELVGVFERLWPCSFQHPTLRDVASWLTEHSGLTFSVPDADYSDRPIPHFTHSGTGYQLLDNLGKAFGITDYVWYQLPDGAVYVGGAEKALFAGRPIEIPHEFNQGAAGGNSMTLPLVQSLRPGVELNGERVTKVHLQNDTMAVTWTPRNRATGKPLQKTPVQRQIESHYPELASGMHLPKFGRVMNPVEAVKSGNFSDPFRPRYAVDVQLLDADATRKKTRLFIRPFRYRFLWRVMIRGCSSFRLKGRWSKSLLLADGRISLLYGRPCRREPASRIFSLANSCNSSARKYRSASPRRGTG